MKRTRMMAYIGSGILFTSVLANSNQAYALSSQLDNPIPYKSITPQVESTIEKTKIRVLLHISEARSDIHRKEYTSAKRNLGEATRLMETIRNDLSTATAKNLIKIARLHLEYEQKQKVLNEFPRIFESLDQSSVYLPTDKAKLHIDRAKVYLEKNDKRSADKELALADNSLIVIEEELPLLKTQRYITRALGYLAAMNVKKADEALQMAERRAMAIQLYVNSPLFLAKQDLWLAFRNYSTATHADTGARLAQARNNLSNAKIALSAKEKEEASKLLAELDMLGKKLEGEGKVAESELKAAWEKSEALAERSAAYLAADVSEAETTLGVESNLIEAKLHVAYAETYQVTTSEPEKAAKELDIAYSYLQKAEKSTLTDSVERKKMHRIGNILLELKLIPKERDRTVQDRYDSVKEDLRNLAGNEKSSDQLHRMQGM